MKYEIQHYTLVDGWVNTSSTVDSDGNEIPLVFDTYAEAQADIDSDLAYIAARFASGEREADYGYDPEEFRVREVAVEPVNPHIHDDGSGGCNCCGVPSNLCDCREDCDEWNG